MKVALVTQWLSSSGGGVATVVEALSAALQHAGVETKVFGLCDELWRTEKSLWQGGNVEAFSTFGPPALGFAPKLRMALEAFGPDIVHTHGIWMFTSGTVAYWGAQRPPYVISPHGMLDGWALGRSQLKKRIARLLFEDRHLLNAAYLHALNRTEATALQNFNLPGPVVTIPNGVACSESTEFGEPPWKDFFGKGAKVLLFLGRLHPKKNVDGLLRAWATILIQGKLEDWRVVIAGWGESAYEAELLALTCELGLDAHVEFVGRLYGVEKDAALHHASAFVLPSYSEGLPMAVLEAWSHGLPVAMTSACNIPEGFSGGAAKEIGTEPSEIVAALGQFLASDIEELEKIGEKGRKLVRENYSWPELASRFITLYSSMEMSKS